MPVAAHLPAVYEITDRPDLVAETTSALNRALRQAHLAGDFWPDLMSENIPTQNLVDFAHAIPDRFRRVSAIFNMGVPPFSLKEVPPAALFNREVLMDKRNSYYLAGTQIRLHVEDSFSSLRFEFLRFPTFDDSFIMVNYKEAVIYEAAALVFDGAQNKQQADKYRGLANAARAEILFSSFVIQQS
jgi:hypothetical protein